MARSSIYRELKAQVEASGAVVVSSVQKVPARELNRLRFSLRDIDSNFMIAKNSISRILCREQGWQDMEKLFEGTCAISPVKGDAAKVCKLLATFQKDHEGFVIQGGILEGQFYSKDQLIALSKLPSREVLLSQLAGLLQGPIRNLAVVLQAPIREAALAFKALAQKREKEGKQEKPAS
ncbi:MAG: 50S ribosomal protein L10 [Candidatus Omnitrophica bacterium]|nr:50S ribosomal protein L10 [Candidatus Omnitrophota bacterium]